MLVVFKMINDTPGNRHKPELSETKQWSYEKVLSVFFGQTWTAACSLYSMLFLKQLISPSQSDHVTPEKKSGFSNHHDCSSDGSSGDAYTPDHNCHYSSVGVANYED